MGRELGEQADGTLAGGYEGDTDTGSSKGFRCGDADCGDVRRCSGVDPRIGRGTVRRGDHKPVEVRGPELGKLGHAGGLGHDLDQGHDDWDRTVLREQISQRGSLVAGAGDDHPATRERSRHASARLELGPQESGQVDCLAGALGGCSVHLDRPPNAHAIGRVGEKSRKPVALGKRSDRQ